MTQLAMTRERDFADFLQYAPEEELIRQAQLLNTEIQQKYSNVRSNVADLLRDRLSMINTTLGLAA